VAAPTSGSSEVADDGGSPGSETPAPGNADDSTAVPSVDDRAGSASSGGGGSASGASDDRGSGSGGGASGPSSAAGSGSGESGESGDDGGGGGHDSSGSGSGGAGPGPPTSAAPIAPAPVTRSFTLVGGTVSVTCVGATATAKVTPAVGFSVQGGTDLGPDASVDVRLRRDTPRHDSELRATCSAGVPTVTDQREQ
jgi:hypothetical protein